MNILIVDDDNHFAHNLSTFLREKGFNTIVKYNGLEAISTVSELPIDIIIMDAAMPLYDGISAMKEIKQKANIPIFIMSERDSKEDILYAYQNGAYDYLRKPILLEELLFKINNFYHDQPELFDFNGLKIDTVRREILVDELPIKATNKEFDLLLYLVKNKGVAIRREELLSDVWGYGFFGDDRTLDTHIKTLRKHLGRYKNIIKTIRGFGYKLEA